MNRDVIAQLGRAARQASTEKSAGLLGGLGKRLFTAAPAVGNAGRVFSGRRTAATLTGLGLGGGALADKIINHPRNSWNPLRYDANDTSGMKPEDAYRFHTERFNQKVNPFNSAIQAAQERGDTEQADMLMRRMSSGNYGADGLRPGLLRRLNPFGAAYTDTEKENMQLADALKSQKGLGMFFHDNQDAGFNQQQATHQQGLLQDEYRKAVLKSNPDALNRQLEAARQRMHSTNNSTLRGMNQRQIDLLQQKMKSMPPGGVPDDAQRIAERMRAAGMEIPSMAGVFNRVNPSAGLPTPAAPWYALGGRPQASGMQQGNLFNPNDFRSNYEEDLQGALRGR